MKIYNLLTAISTISLSQFGEAAGNFPRTGTSLVEKNPYPPVGKDIARSLANKNEDIPGCAHMDTYTLCDVAETVTDANGLITSTSYSKDCKALKYFCLEEAMITYDVCVNENDIGDDIFFGIELDLSTVSQYFRFKLMLNGMEQEIDPKSYSIIPSPDGSKGLCLRYQTNMNGCKDKLDFTAGVVFFPDGKNIDSQDEQCTGNDPFVLQVRNLLDLPPPPQTRGGTPTGAPTADFTSYLSGTVTVISAPSGSPSGAITTATSTSKESSSSMTEGEIKGAAIGGSISFIILSFICCCIYLKCVRTKRGKSASGYDADERNTLNLNKQVGDNFHDEDDGGTVEFGQNHPHVTLYNRSHGGGGGGGFKDHAELGAPTGPRNVL